MHFSTVCPTLSARGSEGVLKFGLVSVFHFNQSQFFTFCKVPKIVLISCALKIFPDFLTVPFCYCRYGEGGSLFSTPFIHQHNNISIIYKSIYNIHIVCISCKSTIGQRDE